MGGQTDALQYLEEDDNSQNPNSLHHRSKSPEPSSEKLSQLETTQLEPAKSPEDHKWKLNWIMVFLIAFIHFEAVIGLVLGVTHAKVASLVWYFILIQFGATGIICGAHRLWTHRAYKAGVPFRIFLMLCNTLALQVRVEIEGTWRFDILSLF